MSMFVPASRGDVSATVTAASRTTITSRLRFEKNHQDHDAGHGQGHIHNHGQGQGHHHGQGHAAHDVCGGGGGDAYLTPFQRKDLLIKEMRAHVKDLNRQVEARERQIEELRGNVEDEKEQTQAKQRAELEEAGALAESARKEVTSLKESHGESVRTVASLQQQLEDVKRDMAEKLASAEDIFLEMYKKGRESAIFEREEELELQGKGGRSLEATEQDLRNKLVRTQAELAKWQTLQRHESYHTSPVPGTEAETTLRFLKDSVFHFLVSDRKTGDEHLRAIVRILRFSEVQREKIAHAIIYRRNKTSW